MSQKTQSSQQPMREPATFAGIIVVYLLLMAGALQLVSPQERISLLWFPGGFLLGSLVFIPYRKWLSLLIPLFLAGLGLELITTSRPFGMILSFVSINLLESTLGALMFCSFCGGKKGFHKFQHLSIFIVTSFAIPSVTAWLGASTVIGYGLSKHFFNVYVAWLTSVSLGFLLIVPLIIHGMQWWRQKLWKHFDTQRGLLAIWFMMLIIVCLASILKSEISFHSHIIVFFSLPLLCWGAIQFGLWGAVSASVVLAASTIVLTSLGYGPLWSEGLSPLHQVLELQTYLLTAIIAALFTAVAVERLHKVSFKLAETGARFRTLFHHSPVSLWEEDLSEIKKYLDRKQSEGIDIIPWLQDNPEEAEVCARMVKVLSVNDRTIEMLGASSQADLLKGLPVVFAKDSYKSFRHSLISFWKGETEYRVETVHQKLDQTPIPVMVRIMIAPSYEKTWERVFVAIEDLSEQKQAAHSLNRFFEQPMNLHLLASLDGEILRVNDTWHTVLGRSRPELEKSNFLDLVHPEDREATLKEMSSLADGKTTYYFENRYRHRDDSYRLLAWSASADLEKQIIYAVANDITAQQQREKKLREAAAVFRSTAEGVTITDLNGTIIEVNEAFTNITGYTRQEVLGSNPNILQSGRHDTYFYKDMWAAILQKGWWRGEIWNRRKNGSVYPELLTINTVKDDYGKPTGYVGVFADISTLKQTEERLEHLAHHDSLTGLPNRLLFNARLKQSIRHARRQNTMLALIFVDLDRFKHINDSMGHPVGDDLLQQLSERLVNSVRADDTVARLSGDEFVVLLEGIKEAEDTIVAVEKLMTIFSNSFDLAGKPIQVTASLGLSIFPQDGEDAETLLRNADAAMYKAKEDGRNTYNFYTEELTKAAQEHLFIENALHSAFENNEFYLVYQPQVMIETGQSIGMEALLRWQHPKEGLISPVRFIPVAEQTGFIRELGAWVLHEACRQGKSWLDQGLPIGRISVNVAGPQINHNNFVKVVEDVLNETGFPREHLGLEVTEGFVMERARKSTQQLEELRASGIEISIDDFGTGYSSLSYLKQLPIDKLKVDRSFVRDIPEDKDDMAIAEAVISMSKALNLAVIAEGVETEEQAKFLKGKGCFEAQGYFYSRPLESKDIPPFLQKFVSVGCAKKLPEK